MSADVMIFLLICLYLVKAWMNHKRIRQLEDKLMSVLQDEYITFAKGQLHLSKIDFIKSLRQRFPELSLVQAVQVYELAIKS